MLWYVYLSVESDTESETAPPKNLAKGQNAGPVELRFTRQTMRFPDITSGEWYLQVLIRGRPSQLNFCPCYAWYRPTRRRGA